jgi:hypothetical protein
MTKKINNLDVGIVDEMRCDRLLQLKNLPAVLLLTVETRRTPSLYGVGIVLGIVQSMAAALCPLFRRVVGSDVCGVCPREVMATGWSGYEGEPGLCVLRASVMSEPQRIWRMVTARSSPAASRAGQARRRVQRRKGG